MRLHAGRGWTLVEFVIVLIVGALLLYFTVRAFQPKEALALQQAERLRNDLRHMQMLALAWGRPLGLTVAAGSYQVCCLNAAMSACVTEAAPSPCTANPLTDPATGRPFLISLESGLALGGAGLNFDALGRPRSGATLNAGPATFDISGAGSGRSVTVAAITGFATAQ